MKLKRVGMCSEEGHLGGGVRGFFIIWFSSIVCAVKKHTIEYQQTIVNHFYHCSRCHLSYISEDKVAPFTHRDTNWIGVVTATILITNIVYLLVVVII